MHSLVSIALQHKEYFRLFLSLAAAGATRKGQSRPLPFPFFSPSLLSSIFLPPIMVKTLNHSRRVCLLPLSLLFWHCPSLFPFPTPNYIPFLSYFFCSFPPPLLWSWSGWWLVRIHLQKACSKHANFCKLHAWYLFESIGFQKMKLATPSV